MSKSNKHPNGYYRKTINIGIDENGKRQYKHIYGKTKKELEEKVEAFNNDLRNGVNPNLKNIRFKELSLLWLEYNVNMSLGTKKQYEGMLRNVIWDSIGNHKIKDLRVFDLQELLNNLYSKGMSKSYLRKVKIICVQTLNLAIDNKYIAYNPFLTAQIPNKANEGERSPLSDAQEQAILKHWKGHRMGLASLILLTCGLRKGELIALQWSDIDLKNNVIHITKSVEFDSNGNTPSIKTPKSNNGVRDIPINQTLLDALRSEKKKGLFVVTDSSGNIMSKQAFKRGWESYLNYLNRCCGGKDAVNGSVPKVLVLEPFTAHQLRHTYATNLYYSDVKPKQAQYLLGHSDIKTTLNIYTHLDKGKVSSDVEKYLRMMDLKTSELN